MIYLFKIDFTGKSILAAPDLLVSHDKNGFFHFCPVFLSPLAIPPKSFHDAVFQIFAVLGSFISCV